MKLVPKGQKLYETYQACLTVAHIFLATENFPSMSYNIYVAEKTYNYKFCRSVCFCRINYMIVIMRPTMDYSVFDIIGLRMVGPSSSHTAGAARLGKVARRISGNDVV